MCFVASWRVAKAGLYVESVFIVVFCVASRADDLVVFCCFNAFPAKADRFLNGPFPVTVVVGHLHAHLFIFDAEWNAHLKSA